MKQSPRTPDSAVVCPGNGFPEKVAVLRALQLGDLLCAVPSFRAMRRAWPAARITLVGLPWARTFVARFAPYLDDFQEFPGFDGIPELGFEPSRMEAFVARGNAFDIAIQLHGDGSVTNRFLPKLRPALTAGFFPVGQSCPDPDRFIEYPDGEHEIRRLLALVRHLGLPVAGEDLEFPLTQQDYHEAEQAATAGRLRPGCFVCVHIGARDAKRCWPLEDFNHVAQELAARGQRIVLTGTSEEADKTACLSERLGTSCLDLTGKTSVGGLGALLKRARLLISNDTGVSHLAVALRVPSVVVFSASNPRRWAPLDTNRHRSLGDPFASPEVRASPDEVLREAFSLLDEEPLRLEARGGGFPVLPAVNWNRVKRVLLVHEGSEADLVLLASSVAALRSPGCALALLTSPSGAAVAPLFPGIDRLLVAEQGSLEEPIEEAPVRELVDQLRAASFDAAIIFTRPDRSPYPAAYICYLAGIPLRIGASKEFGGALLSHWVRKFSESLGPEERYLALLRAVALPSQPQDPGLVVPAAVEAKVKTELRTAVAGGSLALIDYEDADGEPPDTYAERLRDLTGLDTLDRRSFRAASVAELACLVQSSELVVTSRPVTARLTDAFRRPLIATGAAASPPDGWCPRRSVSKLLTGLDVSQDQLLQAVRILLWRADSRKRRRLACTPRLLTSDSCLQS